MCFQLSPKQMRMVLILAVITVAPSDPNLPSCYWTVDDNLVDNLSVGAQILEPPGSPVLREKVVFTMVLIVVLFCSYSTIPCLHTAVPMFNRVAWKGRYCSTTNDY